MSASADVPASLKPERRQAFRWWLTLAVSVVLVVLLVRFAVGADAVLAAFARASPWPIVGAVLVVGVNVALDALRWFLVLSAMKVPVSYPRALRAVVATWPLSVVFPSRAGDFARAAYLKPSVPLVSGLGSVLAGKMVDAQNLALFAVAGCLVLGVWVPALVAAGVWAAIGLLALAMVLSTERVKRFPWMRRRPDRVDQIVQGLRALGRAPRIYFALVALSLLSWANVSLIVALLLQAFGASVSFVYVWAMFPFASFVGTIPVTLGGLGTRDAAFLFALSGVGAAVEPGAVLSATLGYAAVGTWLPSLFGLPWLVRDARRTG